MGQRRVRLPAAGMALQTQTIVSSVNELQITDRILPFSPYFIAVTVNEVIRKALVPAVAGPGL